MNSWTDIALIIAIVIGLISAASLPMVSVNAVSPESLRLSKARNEQASPWVLVREGQRELQAVSPSVRDDPTAATATAGTDTQDRQQTRASAQ